VTRGDPAGAPILARALDAVFAAAAELIAREERLRVLEVSGGAGQWAELARRHEMEYLEASAEGAISVPDAGAEVVVGAGALGGSEPHARGGLVERMWRALAPGGWLVIAEELVPGDDPESRSDAGLGALDLEALLVDGTGGGAILEHFEALRHPQEDLRRTGLAVCSKPSGTRDPVRVHGLALSATSPSQQELGYGSRG
jgi:hypothetical protein